MPSACTLPRSDHPSLMTDSPETRIAVVIPCYRVKDSILKVLSDIGANVWKVYVVDDACPEKTGEFVLEHFVDSRVEVVFNSQNLGVGGAVLNGYLHAVEDGADVIVKLDGDGQMDSRFIPALVKPILEGKADYTKGNRFFSPDNLISMPYVRMFGNSVLSFINKAVSGYWNTMDPTNGFTAIHANVIRLLPIEAISKRYFFESDMLFRLGTYRAVVKEVPMRSIYQDEESNLNVGHTMLTFPMKFMRRFVLRIGYNYFVRDFNVCSLELVFGTLLLGFGGWFGITSWIRSIELQIATPIGTVMLAVLPIILGFQLLLSAISFDVANVPDEPIHPALDDLPQDSTDIPTSGTTVSGPKSRPSHSSSSLP